MRLGLGALLWGRWRTRVVPSVLIRGSFRLKAAAQGAIQVKRLYLFGQPELYEANGEFIPVRAAKYAHLLGYLWIHRSRSHPRERLAGLFWPEMEETQARLNLRQALHHLRSALEPDQAERGTILQINPSSVQLVEDGPLWVDIAQFQEHLGDAEETSAERRIRFLEQAIDLYRGEFLEGCYDDWCLEERERLRDQLTHALEGLTVAVASRGDHRKAIDYAKRILHHHPLREDVHRQLMQLYRAVGDRSSALQQFGACASVLRDELSVDPAAQTQALYQEIVSGDGESTPRSAESSPDSALAAHDSGRPSQWVQPRVAVLPLLNISPNPEDEYLADGLTEELILALSKVGDLRVIAQTSIMRFKGTSKGVAEIGAELDVGFILEGSVRKDGERIRIAIQLIDARTEEHLWAESYDRKLEDVFAIQRDIAEHVADHLKVELLETELSRAGHAPTASLEAYRLYLKGRHWLGKRTHEGIQTGLQCLQQALDIDPAYARAYAGLADVYIAFGIYYVSPPKEVFPQAKRFAEQACHLDPELADGYASWAYASVLNCESGRHIEESFQKGLELDRSYVTGYASYGNYLMGLGRFEDASKVLEQAHFLDPLSPFTNVSLGLWPFFARQYDEGVTTCRQLLDRDPANYLLYWPYGMNLMGQGDLDKAIEELHRGLEIEHAEPIRLEMTLAHVYALAGKESDAREIIERYEDRPERPDPTYEIAVVYAGLGETDNALAWLERAYAQRSHGLLALKIDPRLDPVADHPRCRELLEKLGRL